MYAVCQPVLDKLLKAAEIPPDQMRIILEKDLGMGEELWETWQSIPRDSKKVSFSTSISKIGKRLRVHDTFWEDNSCIENALRNHTAKSRTRTGVVSDFAVLNLCSALPYLGMIM